MYSENKREMPPSSEIEKPFAPRRLRNLSPRQLPREEFNLSAEEQELLETSISSIKDQCGDSIFEEWIPVKVIGGGRQGTIIQVCDFNNCQYVLKVGSALEVDFAIKMGKVGLSPLIYETKSCGDEIIMIAEKMDGDLSTFLYPPTRMDEIMPQVLNIIYEMIAKYRICHRDTKVNNFLWKQVNNEIRIYVTDFGSADICTSREVENPENLKRLLISHLSIFNTSFIKPNEYNVTSSLGYESLVSSNHEDWIFTFLQAERNALINNKNWQAPSNILNKIAYFGLYDTILKEKSKKSHERKSSSPSRGETSLVSKSSERKSNSPTGEKPKSGYDERTKKFFERETNLFNTSETSRRISSILPRKTIEKLNKADTLLVCINNTNMVESRDTIKLVGQLKLKLKFGNYFTVDDLEGRDQDVDLDGRFPEVLDRYKITKKFDFILFLFCGLLGSDPDLVIEGIEKFSQRGSILVFYGTRFSTFGSELERLESELGWERISFSLKGYENFYVLKKK